MATTKELRELNIKTSLADVAKATTQDLYIIQSIHTYEEITACINKLAAMAKERLSVTAPFAAKTTNNILALAKDPKTEDIGQELPPAEKEQLKRLADMQEQLIQLQQQEQEYMTKNMQEVCPKLNKVATPLIGARLLSIAGSLKNLAKMPSSTVQVLGAEKALFRHLRTGAKAPKFGIIFAHQKVTTAPHKAKAARKLAAEIAIAAREDYFGRKN